MGMVAAQAHQKGSTKSASRPNRAKMIQNIFLCMRLIVANAEFGVVSQFEIQNRSDLASSRAEPRFRRREGSPTRKVRGKEIPQPAEGCRLSG